MSGSGDSRMMRAAQEHRREQLDKAGICPVRSPGEQVAPCEQDKCAWWNKQSSTCAVLWIAQVIGHHGEHLREGIDAIAQGAQSP